MEASRTFERIQHLLPQLEQEDSQKSVYLRFMLAPDRSALLEMAQVEETLVVASETITPVPNLPRWFLGLLNSRNQVFSVIDLPQLLGLPAIAAQQCHVVVIRALRPQEMRLGLRVQRIQGLIRLESQQITNALSPMTGPLASYGQGHISLGSDALLLLDLDAIAHQLLSSASA